MMHIAHNDGPTTTTAKLCSWSEAVCERPARFRSAGGALPRNANGGSDHHTARGSTGSARVGVVGLRGTAHVGGYNRSLRASDNHSAPLQHPRRLVMDPFRPRCEITVLSCIILIHGVHAIRGRTLAHTQSRKALHSCSCGASSSRRRSINGVF